MRFFFWLAFLIMIGVAIFAIQNSSAPPVVMKFLAWKFETSLVSTILGSIGAGILIILFLWIPSAIKHSFRVRNLKKEVGVLTEMKNQIEANRPKDPRQDKRI